MIDMSVRWLRCGAFLILASLLTSCSALEDALESSLLGTLAVEPARDQGHVYVDDTGNITVVLTNAGFASMPGVNPGSIVMVWVFPRGADPRQRCCSGSGCSDIQEKSCPVGVGFSNDLGFAGSFYINIHPPQPFDVDAREHYMPVFVSDNQGVPQNYQGEYQDFSGPTNPVGDREQFDLYLGFYFSAFSPLYPEPRVIQVEAELDSQTIVSAPAPDLLSPVIPIETRFFPESPRDSSGSVATIPPMISWRFVADPDAGLRVQNQLRISEIGNAILGQTENDFIEITNPTPLEVPLLNMYLNRWSTGNCAALGGGNDRMNLSALSIPPNGSLAIARSGHTLSGISATFSGGVIVSDNDCFALNSGSSSIFAVDNFRVYDFVGLGGSAAFETAPARELLPNEAISRCPSTSDTNNNQLDFALRPLTPGQVNFCTAVIDQSSLLINEWGASSNGGEQYIELKNFGSSAIIIDRNLRLIYGASSLSFPRFIPAGAGDPALAQNLDEITVNPGEIVVIAESDVSAANIATLGIGARQILISSKTTLIGASERLSDVRAYLTNGVTTWSRTPDPVAFAGSVGTSTYSVLRNSFSPSTQSVDDTARWCNGNEAAHSTPGANNATCP